MTDATRQVRLMDFVDMTESGELQVSEDRLRMAEGWLGRDDRAGYTQDDRRAIDDFLAGEAESLEAYAREQAKAAE